MAIRLFVSTENVVLTHPGRVYLYIVVKVVVTKNAELSGAIQRSRELSVKFV
jgi:hypothetical protein